MLIFECIPVISNRMPPHRQLPLSIRVPFFASDQLSDYIRVRLGNTAVCPQSIDGVGDVGSCGRILVTNAVDQHLLDHIGMGCREPSLRGVRPRARIGPGKAQIAGS
jgi:hypothetical protein